MKRKECKEKYPLGYYIYEDNIDWDFKNGFIEQQHWTNFEWAEGSRTYFVNKDDSSFVYYFLILNNNKVFCSNLNGNKINSYFSYDGENFFPCYYDGEVLDVLEKNVPAIKPDFSNIKEVIAKNVELYNKENGTTLIPFLTFEDYKKWENNNE